MIKDSGGRSNLGFGVPLQENTVRGDNGNGTNIVEKTLNGHPVMRFFAVAAASAVGMHVAGKIVREGGLRLGEFASKEAIGVGENADFWQKSVRTYRRIESALDDLQGLGREFVDEENPDVLVKRIDGRLQRDKTHLIDDFNIRNSNIDRDPELSRWTARDEVQQRLVAQARRLPYELPGFYVAQKAILDPLLGSRNPKDKVNWHSPIDVIGDFAYQSTKNLAMNILPFDLGLGAAKTGYGNYALKAAAEPAAHTGMLTVKTMLAQLGADAGDLTSRVMKYSQSSLGAFSTTIKEASESGKGFSDWVRSQKNAAFTHEQDYQNSNFAQRLFKQAQNVTQNKDSRRQAIDMLPGPFKGMGSSISNFGKTFGELNQVHDDWQDLMQGKTRLQTLRNNPQTKDRYLRLMDYMAKGGGTSIEQYGQAAFNLGKGGPILPDGRPNMDWRKGQFVTDQRQTIYKGLLTDELAKTTGLTPQQAMKFVQTADTVSPYAGARSGFPGGENLMQRFRFEAKQYHGAPVVGNLKKSNDDWWESITRAASAHGINPKDKFTFDLFQQSVRAADHKFTSQGFRSYMDGSIQEQWKTIHGLASKQAGQTIGSLRRPWEQFVGNKLEQNQEFLIRKTAQKLGIYGLDQTGNALPLNTLKQQISKSGLNPENLHTLRGYLVSNKEIGSALRVGGANVFGFRPLTMEEGLNNQFYGGSSKGAQREIQGFVNDRTFSGTAGRGGDLHPSMQTHSWDLKINKVYVGPNGTVLDFDRISRNLHAGFNKLASSYQIPLIKLKPAQILGSGTFETGANASAIQILDANAVNPISRLAKSRGETNPDFYLWMKANAKGSKGRVTAITGDLFSGTKESQLAGFYRSLSTNPATMAGRNVNILMGQEDVPGSHNWKSKWKRRFDYNYNQENSMLFGKDSAAARVWRGVTGAPSSYSNPVRAAARFGEAGFKPGQMTSFESEGFEKLRETLSGYGFSNRTLKALSNDPAFKNLQEGMTDTLGTNALDIPDNLLPRFIRDALGKDAEKLGVGAEANKVRKLQQNLTNLLDQGERQNNFWGLPAPQSVKATGISTRIDQLKGELYDYMAVRTGIAGADANGGFDATITNLIGKVDELFTQGQISATEKAEGRAAILSLQIENARNLTYTPGATNFAFSHNQQTLERLFGQGINVKELMSEIGSGVASKSENGRIRGTAGRFFASEDYNKPFATKPSGGSNVFMPTFGTAFKNNPRKAVMGLLGMSRDVEAVSGMSIPMEHMVNRLNKQFETFNMGVDPTKYKSPLDQFARGYGMKRILPIYAAGATALAIDKTAGGVVHKDANGNPIYSPLVLGGVGTGIMQGQSILAGVLPGGQTYSSKKKELKSGEVPIRAGRFWLMGNTPFKGGRINYFRPSWYQRLKAGAANTPEMHETPLEKLAFGYDFSPLRPFDPYRREREDYETRPYPVTGDYFTGPFGPINTVLNATVGKILKPHKLMHKEEQKYGLGQYAPVGDAGAYFSQTGISPSQNQVSNQLGMVNTGYMAAASGGVSYGTGTSSGSQLARSTGFAPARGGASAAVRQNVTNIATGYSSIAASPASVPYGVPYQGGMQSRVISSAAPLKPNSAEVNIAKLGYQSQEIAGIYGFTESSARTALGFGNKDFAPKNSILEPSSRGYSASRSFWNMQLGGIGDLPLPIEGQFANLELSEIVRRFVPKEQSGVQYVNNIPNAMGKAFPWLPGSDYPLANVKSGDPYNAIPDAEIRLPGTGYNRTHQQYSALSTAHDILGDIAPWSNEYKSLDKSIDSQNLDPMSRAKIAQTRSQVEAMRYENEFTPYKYKYESITDSATDPVGALGKGWEWLTHRDTYLNTKLGAPHTAVEDWERNNVYGATFPKWETPYSSFIKPAINKASQRDPFFGALAGGGLGYLFGATKEAQAIGSVVGGVIGLSSSIYGHAYKATTGDRFVPLDRRKELALEENVDILDYTRSTMLSNQARQSGDDMTAQYWDQQSKNTMYGADLNGTPEQVSMAIPKRKREHFRAMMYAPPEEREQILSTAGRLERRILEASWGMDVEKKPDLKDYYSTHELPPPDSDVWRPEVSMDTIKIKMGQEMGLDLAQMGYYPQQIQEANLINPSYPSPFENNAGFSMRAKIKRFLFDNQINGQVRSTPSPFGGDRVQLQAGVY